MGNQTSKTKNKSAKEEDKQVCLGDFRVIRALGQGAFGKVAIVQNRETKKLYALKYMNKEKILKGEAIKNVQKEQTILMQIRHPLICNLWFCFQDPEDMFMVMDLMIGGDLGYHISRYGKFDESRVRQYAAEVGCCLQYLHKTVGIVHRDIKPENMLLDSSGHCHIGDFNVATKLPQDPNVKLFSKVGTWRYFPPEMYLEEGYRELCDWWSLGVSLLEMVNGRNIFTGKSEEEMRRKVIKKKIVFVDDNISDECKEVLLGLLDRNPTTRLGGLVGYEKYTDMKWFKDYVEDWEEVPKRNLKPSFIPTPNKIYCDASHELEEIMITDDPIHEKKKRLKKIRRRLEKYGPPKEGTREYEIQQLGEYFQYFDWSKELEKKQPSPTE